MGKKFSVKSIGKWLSENIIIVLIFLASVFVSTQNKNFLSANNIRNLLSNTAVRFIIACGVSGCLITKGTDLSAGRVAGLAACLSGILMAARQLRPALLSGYGRRCRCSWFC